MSILVTGGAGYVGTHICVELFDGGDDVIVMDNFANNTALALKRVQVLCGSSRHEVARDLRDRALVRSLFRGRRIHLAMHLAGLKAVGDAVGNSVECYDNNVLGTIKLEGIGPDGYGAP